MTNHQIARTAGLLYLLLIVSGLFALAIIPSQIIHLDDSLQTAREMKNHLLLFKWGMISEVVLFLSFIVLPIALYRLLASHGSTAAALLLAFSLVSVPISLGNLQHKFEILHLLESTTLEAIELSSSIPDAVMEQLHGYALGSRIPELFWGLWLFPFGYLVFRSGHLPKFLGVMLMIGCFGYLSRVIGPLFFEHYDKTLYNTIISIPSDIGEMGICLWLLIFGSKTISWRPFQLRVHSSLS